MTWVIGMALAWRFGWPPATCAVLGGLSWLASLMFLGLIGEVLWRPRPYFQSSLK